MAERFEEVSSLVSQTTRDDRMSVRQSPPSLIPSCHPMCQSTANVAVTAPQDTAQRLFETFINGAAIEPYLFPQLNNPLAEFLVDEIAQTSDEL